MRDVVRISPQPFYFAKVVDVKCKYIIGIDEAGRGPLAGPVAVGMVCMRYELQPRGKQKDSKKLSAKQREKIFLKLQQQHKAGELICASALVSNLYIDSKGIVPAINLAIKRCLNKLHCQPSECLVLLDGSLRAPKKFVHRQTIIKGDETQPVIALASIVAKVRRDRKMEKLAKLHPEYKFEVHKGYGTRAHYVALKKHGLSALHRKSFLKSFRPK